MAMLVTFPVGNDGIRDLQMVAWCVKLTAMLVTFPIGNDGLRDPQMVAGHVKLIAMLVTFPIGNVHLCIFYLFTVVGIVHGNKGHYLYYCFLACPAPQRLIYHCLTLSWNSHFP